MNADLSVDVAILGAGPAGSTLASLLAERGISVALVDRDRFPRDKLCGEFLSYDALPILEHLGVLRELDESGAPRIDRCRVVGDKAVYEFEIPLSARGVSRMLLDDLLVKRASRGGAEVLEGWTASNLTRQGNKTTITIKRRDETQALTARIVVGAWGRWGRFDKELKRDFVDDASHRHFGFKRHYRPFLDGRQDTIDLYAFNHGYLGVSGVEGGIVNICGLVHRSRLSGLKGGWEHFVQVLCEEKISLRSLFEAHFPVQQEFLSSEPVIFRAKSAVDHGIYMIGDAAGLIDPLTGNGMAMAIQSALIAAPAIVAAVAGTAADSIPARYEQEYERFFGRRIGWSRRIAYLLSRPTLLEGAMRITASPFIGKFLLKKTRADVDEVARRISQWRSHEKQRV